MGGTASVLDKEPSQTLGQDKTKEQQQHDGAVSEISIPLLTSERVVYPNGDIYEGYRKGNIKCGENGLYKYSNGDVYKGSFHDNKKHGEGVYTFGEDGTEKEAVQCRYEGEYVQGEMHGRGRYFYSNGADYRGRFSQGKESGCGTYTMPGQFQYFGNFEDGEMHGVGGITYYAETQEKEGPETHSPLIAYVGEFERGRLHGQTTVFCPSSPPRHTVVTAAVQMGKLVAHSAIVHRIPESLSSSSSSDAKTEVDLEYRPLPALPDQQDSDLSPTHRMILAQYKKHRDHLGLGRDTAITGRPQSTPSMATRSPSQSSVLDASGPRLSRAPSKELVQHLLSSAGASPVPILPVMRRDRSTSPGTLSKSGSLHLTPIKRLSSSRERIEVLDSEGLSSEDNKIYIDSSLAKLRKALEQSSEQSVLSAPGTNQYSNEDLIGSSSVNGQSRDRPTLAVPPTQSRSSPCPPSPRISTHSLHEAVAPAGPKLSHIRSLLSDELVGSLRKLASTKLEVVPADTLLSIKKEKSKYY